MYIITHLMEADLHNLIYSKQKLEADHYQYFMYQILRGLFYMHSANIMHRDLKPSNILINADCDLKICDFGLSRGEDDEVDANIKKTAYVVTRWYRAPEVSLLNKSYNNSLDMWSVGCIFAELLQRQTLFPGGTNTEQVIMMLRILGCPDEKDLDFIDNEHSMVFIQNQRKKQLESDRKPIDWNERIPHASNEAVDLLQNLLAFNPNKRIKVEDAINHPYFKNLRDLDHPPSCSKKFSWSWEAKMQQESEKHKNPHFDRQMICKLIYEESLSFHPDSEEADDKKETTITQLPIKEAIQQSPKKLPSPLKQSQAN